MCQRKRENAGLIHEPSLRSANSFNNVSDVRRGCAYRNVLLRDCCGIRSRTGPAGLEGWTELQTLANGDRVSRTLVIARHGKLIRRISGDPFVWQWKFWENGQQLIFEAGPVHFGMTCVRIDLSTGRTLGSVDCYSNLPPAGNLDWVA